MTFTAIHELVGEAIARFPNHVAVESEHGQLTYTELDARAEHVAAELRTAGAGAGDFIPVLADDRRDVIAAILGVLRIGGVFVPLDLSAPPARLRAMLLDVAPRWAVTGAAPHPAAAQALAAAAPAAHTVTAGPAASGPRGTYGHRPSADDPCYVFFTSGTTGRPKGIVGRLGSVGHYVRWETELLGVAPGWRVSQLVSPSFDAVLRDLFVPLTTGGTVVVPPSGTLLDSAELARWTDEERIDLVHCVPSLFRGLSGAAIAAGRALTSLRCVALSGEQLAPADAERWLARYGGRVRLLNLYGPSETTMTKTFHFVTREDLARPSLPIGRPMPDTEVLLLDEQGGAVAPGSVGEIHLRTPHRSLGYHRRPEENARAFVPNPLTGDAGDIVYRTGDFGRLLADGSLEFLGRKDHQVKIGGVRVELAGVENLLRAHPAVAEAAVTSGTDNGAPFLAAYLETAEGTAETDPRQLHTVLREHLRAHLPDSSVPTVFVPMAELPRTISGKIDRRALPAPYKAPVRDTAGEEPAGTPTERAVAHLWREVLPASGGGPDADFFAEGGSSLLVIELLSRVSSTFAVAVPLRGFLLAPTIRALAESVERELLAADAPLDDLLAL